MPNCQKCLTGFPNHTLIEGKPASLQRRKYCLICSPFRSHNTKTLERTLDVDASSKCSDCSRVYVYDKNKGHTKTRCNSCVIGWARFARKKKALEYKGGKCIDCGYSKCEDALSFHHTDPATKSFGIAGSHNRSWLLVEKELDKCDLLCVRCHVERHHVRNKTTKNVVNSGD